MSTENIVHEKRYRDWRAQYDAMFAPENRSPQQDEQLPLTDGYSIRSKAYLYDGDLHLCGSESELLDKEEVGKGYQLTVHEKMTYKQFLELRQTEENSENSLRNPTDENVAQLNAKTAT